MVPTSNTDAGKTVAHLRLPDEADLAAIGQVAAELAREPASARLAAMVGRGLLRDLEVFFAADANSPVLHGRGVDDLAALVETFEVVADALTPGAAAEPELRLRQCRIERADLSSLEVRFPLHLEHCVFAGEVRLVGTHFRRHARMIGTTFLSEASFFAATFDEGASFDGVNFRGHADFRGATFAGEISFFRANFEQALELKFARFEPAATLNLIELKFRGSSVLGGSLSMARGQFRRGLIVGETSRDHSSLAQACEQYGELEANFASQGSPDSTAAKDLCHYRYMDLRRRTTTARWSPRRLMDWLFLKWCFGYGVYTRRVLCSGLAVIVLFALLYFTNGLGLSREHWAVQYAPGRETNLLDAPWHESLGNALYFSTITFATVGYGDWHPVHWARLAAALEGLSGVFIMSVFTVSFARKIIR